MDSPPPKKSKESTTISMVVERWKRGQLIQHSAVQRIGGYPWRLEINKDKRWLTVQCLKSTEAGLWECQAYLHADITFPNKSDIIRFFPSDFANRKFNSWKSENEESPRVLLSKLKMGMRLEVGISLYSTYANGDEWRLRPTLDESKPRDAILVIGEEKKKIEVNKESLASQSSFFDRLFNGNFKEKDMTEIPIGDVEYEEFSNILKMIYGSDGVSLTDDNVHRVLELADRFDLKIIEDRVVSYLLSPATSLSLIQKLLIIEEFNLPFFKDRIFDAVPLSELRKLGDSPEWDLLSKDSTRLLYKEISSHAMDGYSAISYHRRRF